MGGTILGNCDYCESKIDRDPMLDGPQYCDSCQTHFDLLQATEEILKLHMPGTFPKLEKAVEKFCFTL